MTREVRIPVTRDRFVLLHYHIFKNGGSTIDYALRRSFGDTLVDFHGEHDDARLVAEDIVRLVQEDPGVAAISSHHLRYPRPRVRGVEFHDICFIRHPLARILSLYHYGRRLDPAHWLGQLAQRHDEDGFVAHLVDRSPFVVSDVQLHFLANGAMFSRPAHARDLQQAIERLEDMSVPGVVERFDESLVAGEYFVRPSMPQLDFAHVAQNMSSPEPQRALSSDALLARCRDAWGADTFDTVMLLNAWDLRLHAAANEEVSKRLAAIPRHAARLAAFRKRCRSLAGG